MRLVNKMTKLYIILFGVSGEEFEDFRFFRGLHAKDKEDLDMKLMELKANFEEAHEEFWEVDNIWDPEETPFSEMSDFVFKDTQFMKGVK